MRTRTRKRERDREDEGTEMQFSVNEWIKSGRYPRSPVPDYIVPDRAIERDAQPPSSLPVTVLSTALSRNTRLIPRS